MLTTDQKGAIAEAAIAHAAVELGIGVSRPIGDERYDLLFDLRPEIVRVQCKWAMRYGDVVVVRCYSSRRTADGLLRKSHPAGIVRRSASIGQRTTSSPLHLVDITGP